MIKGALGRVEVRRSPEVGLMAKTIVDGALVFLVLFSFLFLGSFPLSVFFDFGYLYDDLVCIECSACVYFVLV